MLRDLEVPDEAYATILPKALKDALERWSDDIPVVREVSNLTGCSCAQQH